MQFPVFTSGAICAHGYCHIPSTQVPVRVGGVTVHPGDLLHGDRNGVTTVPVEIASEAAHACAEFAQAEKVISNYLETGDASVVGYAEACAECRSMIEKLRVRLAHK
jgi:regulator of RNase E activity RraA